MIALLASIATLGCLLAAASRLLHQQEIWGAGGGALRTDRELGHPGEPPGLLVPEQRESSGPRPQHGELVFAQPMAEGRIGLDCLLTDTTCDDDASRPVHLVAALPANPWLAAVEQELLQQWLDQGDAVDVSVSEDRAGPRVKIACRRTTLMLDQQPA